MRALLATAAVVAVLAPRPAAAESVSAVDGTYVVDLPSGWSADEDGKLHHGRDAMTVHLQGCHETAGLQPADLLHTLANKADAGIVTYTWSGRDNADRTAGCIDTKKATAQLKPELRTWCAVEVEPGRVAVLVMETRDILNARSHAATARKLLPSVTAETRPTTPPPPQVANRPTNPSSWEGRFDQGVGYRCYAGRWNPDGPPDDLRVYWKAETHEMVARFRVLDGGEVQTYYLGGTMEVGEATWSGRLDRFEGATSSKSGVHRLLAGLDAQGDVRDDALLTFRTSRDRDATRLSACPDAD